MQTTSLPFFRQSARPRTNLNLSGRHALTVKVLQALSVFLVLMGLITNMNASNPDLDNPIPLLDFWVADLWCILAAYWSWLLVTSMAQQWIYKYEAEHAINRLIILLILHTSFVVFLRSVIGQPIKLWMFISLVLLVANIFKLILINSPYSKKEDQEDIRFRSTAVKVLIVPLLIAGCVTLVTSLHTMTDLRYTNTNLIGHTTYNSPKFDTHMERQAVVVLILSSWSTQGAARRNMVRQTTLQLLPPKIDYRFVLGEPPSPWAQAKLGRRLVEESKLHGDILIVPSSDSRSSEKLLEAMRWSLQVNYDYLVKTDDDVFVRWDVLGKELLDLGPQNAYWKGLRYRHMPANFDRQKHVQYDQGSARQHFSLKLMPDYTSGALITLSRDLVTTATQNREPRILTDAEDQSLGLWLFSSPYKPIHDFRIQDLDVCEKNQIAKRFKLLSGMKIMLDNIRNNRPQCTQLDSTRCAVCYPCHGKTDDWRQRNLACDLEKGVSPGKLPFVQISNSPVRDTLQPSVIGQNDAWILDKVLSQRTSKYSEGKDWNLLYWVCWTSDPSTFTDRHWRALELVWIHEPRAVIFMLSNTLPTDFFKDYTRYGYNIHLINFNKQNLLSWNWYFGPGTRDWIEDWERWEKSSFFYWHLTDYLRYVLLYNYGGTYMDMDALWIRAPPLPDLEYIGSDVSSLDSDSAWTLDASRLYLPQGVMRFKRGMSMFREMAETAFSAYTYDPSCFNCGGPKAITTYVREHRTTLEEAGFTILPRKVLYPANYLDIHKWLLPDALAEQKLEKIQPTCWSIHLFGKMTNHLPIQEGSIVEHVLQRLDLDLPHRDTKTRAVISSTNSYDVPLRLVGPRKYVYQKSSATKSLRAVAGKFQGLDAFYIRGGPAYINRVTVEAAVDLGQIQLGDAAIGKTASQTIEGATHKDVNLLLHTLTYHPNVLHLANDGRDSLRISLYVDDAPPQQFNVILIVVGTEVVEEYQDQVS